MPPPKTSGVELKVLALIVTAALLPLVPSL